LCAFGLRGVEGIEGIEVWSHGQVWMAKKKKSWQEETRGMNLIFFNNAGRRTCNRVTVGKWCTVVVRVGWLVGWTDKDGVIGQWIARLVPGWVIWYLTMTNSVLLSRCLADLCGCP